MTTQQGPIEQAIQQLSSAVQRNDWKASGMWAAQIVVLVLEEMEKSR